MLPWILSVLLALAAGLFFLLWRRAQSSAEQAERQMARRELDMQAAAETCRRAAARLAALHLAQTEAVLFISPDRIVLDLNPAAAELFKPHAATGSSLIAVTRSAELDDLAAHTLAGGADCDRQMPLGSEAQPYRIRAAQVGEQGEFGAALVLQDVSALQRLGRARRDFVANISHELRTPLTSIRLVVEGLLNGAPREPERAAAQLQQINTDVQALEQMAQELLDLAQIESGKAIVRMVPMPVSRLAANAMERLAPQAAHKHLTLTVDVPPELTALADEELATRALGNLLHNAIKFTPPQGHIWVRARPDGEDVLIEVADTGPGISPADLPRVFERFFRSDRSRAGGGTGLGLAIVKHIVEAHGGRVWVESEGYPGRGAIFRFTLPAEN